SAPPFLLKISFILARDSLLRDGLRYRIVLSMSECPRYDWTVLKSTPAQRHFVANVARNLCSQKSSSFRSARFATVLRQSRKSNLGLHPLVGKTKLHDLSACFFHSFNRVIRVVGTGISRSLYAFGVQPLSGLWLTRTDA